MTWVKKLGFVAVAGTLLAGGSFVALQRHRHRVQAAAHAETVLAPRVAKPFEAADAAEVIYDGKLMPGWNDWGWGPHELPDEGPAKITFAGFGGIILQHTLLEAHYSGLSFRYKAPAEWSRFLQVALKTPDNQSADVQQLRVEERNIAPLPDGFSEVLIPWSELDPSDAPFERIVISAAAEVGNEPVLIDKIFLLRGDASKRSAPAPQAVALEIQCGGGTRSISPLIYGSSDGDWESGTTARRLGGNPTTRYNWDIDAWNSANDWFFENQKAPSVPAWLDENIAHHVTAAVTVPTIGWVAKDTTSVGFPAGLGGAQKVDPNRPEAGNGISAAGKPIPPGPPTLTSIAAPPDMIGRWVKTIRDRDEARGVRSAQSYILDNEPSLWSDTHRDVHPDALGYDELLDRTVRYASEIRKADPDAQIAGPAEWGWLNYWDSAKDRGAGKTLRPDRRLHGDEPLIPWYLKKLAQYERDHGTRLLDILDVHFYPAADGVYGGAGRTDREGSALRLRSTRALWDPTYVDESWINEPIKLIPLLKSWVAANYPGLRISIGEWSFGADGHISGGLATAEALGRFGQQGLDSAYYWGGPKKDTATFWAFRAFRNFDGAGGHFLDVSLSTRESPNVSLFASRDQSRKHLVAVLVNRDPTNATNASIALPACGTVKMQKVFGYVAGATGLVERAPLPLASGAVAVRLPPYSLTVLDLQTEAAF